MTASPPHQPTWSTASFGDDGSTTPKELQALGEHLRVCAHLTGRWASLQGAMRDLAAYAAGHVITSLITLIALALLLLPLAS
ncbi:hypothetical protein [Leptothrix discophora]|uniref:Uncharacterized protein n=1 Tax=Leptothrix discophora TaxID=89 RepID=A0ABT9G8Q5_LEPDI|nr:hypothetical protein [Leptothrix discophora]MDP4302790.1 hypothetical protein [Leptothrix discophora]